MTHEQIEEEVISFLVTKILALAFDGIHKKSIYNLFQPIFRVAYVTQAIKIARGKGMYSVSRKKDKKLGTFYRVEVEDQVV